MSLGDSRQCPICETSARVVCVDHPGYQVGDTFEIVHCPQCDTSHAEPLALKPELYDQLYAVVNDMRGYARYSSYADIVLSSADPLDALAEAEDVYWAVKTCLDGRRQHGGRVLEVGCGLGYLTFAMRSAGYDAQGLDVSEAAIESALARFGQGYFAGDVVAFSRQNRGMYDVVVISEVIEHVPNVLEILRSIRNSSFPEASAY